MLRILTYHRIATPGDQFLNPRLISAAPEEFSEQMSHAVAEFDVVSACDVVDWVLKGRKLPRRALLVTFDDAYRDFAQYAWPVMRHYGVPPVLFVSTAFPGTDQPFWWDRLYRALKSSCAAVVRTPELGELTIAAGRERWQQLRELQNTIKSLPHSQAMSLVENLCRALSPFEIRAPRAVLDWNELRVLASSGVTLGAHTRTHPVLTQLSPQQLIEEIAGSQRDLQREIGHTLPIFAYPTGAWNPAVLDALRRAGIAVGFIASPGMNHRRSAHPLLLARTNITLRTSRSLFRARISLLGAWLDMQRERMRRHA